MARLTTRLRSCNRCPVHPGMHTPVENPCDILVARRTAFIADMDSTRNTLLRVHHDLGT